jgi:phospholipid transport system transporter-binding protein
VSEALRIDRIDVGHVRVAGDLGFANAGEGVARADELPAGAIVDLGGLSRPDSATLGVLLIWAARAAKRGTRFRFTNVPEGLRALAHLCDAEPLLGFV